MSKYRNKTTFSSFRYAIRGLLLAVKSQRNFRMGIFMGLTAIIATILLKFNFIETAIIILTIGFVLFAELINTVIEFIVDAYFGNNHSEIAGMSKDIAAGTVFLSVVIAAIIGGLLFFPKIYVFVNDYFFNVNPLVSECVWLKPPKPAKPPFQLYHHARFARSLKSLYTSKIYF